MPQGTYIKDKDGLPTEFDSTSASGTGYGYLIQIPSEHHKIHEGVHYTGVDYDSDVDIAAPKYWHIKAPASGVIHLTWKIRASLNGLAELYEAPTTTADGTGVTPYNNDRNSANTSTLLFYKDPTVTVDGTLLDIDVIGSDGANPVGADGGDLERDLEWNLKQNTAYLIKFTAGTDDCRASIHLNYYEVL